MEMLAQLCKLNSARKLKNAKVVGGWWFKIDWDDATTLSAEALKKRTKF
jgi:hypothetical protein